MPVSKFFSILTLRPLRFLLLSGLAILVFGIFGDAARATDVDTKDGRHMADCEVLKADHLGIYFRHREGIARVLYEELSDELLAALAPLPENSDDEVETTKAVVRQEAVAETIKVGALQYRSWQRVTYGVAEIRAPCCLSRGRIAVHRYSRFGCRQLAELDFLITSGILPRPPGVATRRLPLRSRLGYF